MSFRVPTVGTKDKSRLGLRELIKSSKTFCNCLISQQNEADKLKSKACKERKEIKAGNIGKKVINSRPWTFLHLIVEIYEGFFSFTIPKRQTNRLDITYKANGAKGARFVRHRKFFVARRGNDIVQNGLGLFLKEHSYFHLDVISMYTV